MINRTKICDLTGSARLLFNERSTRNDYICRKSKSIKKSCALLFYRTHDGKTQRLVQEIVDFEYIVTSSEHGSLNTGTQSNKKT